MIDDPLIGRQLANFRIERIIGRGGMAAVYYGQDVTLRRPVAIKVIDARYRDNPTYAERFVREAQAVALWRHEHIIHIYYAGEDSGLYYFVMEYIDGADLGQFITQSAARRERLPHKEVIRIGRAMASALDYAHQHGVVHRDVKPANVLLARDGRLVLTDFGLAMDVQQGSFGEVFGSSLYIAPEQARRSAEAVPQSDQYSLGVMLYQMLTGALPFADPSPTSVALQHMTRTPPPPRQLNPALNAETEQVLLKVLSKAPADRFANCRDLIEALEQALGLAAANARTVPSKATLAGAGAEALIGLQFDEYRLDALLGHGGMARVYLARDLRLNRPAAVKVIDDAYRGEEDYVARFRREAQAIAALDHPHIVRLYRSGEVSGVLYMAMQYIEGRDLDTILEAEGTLDRRLPLERVQQITADICAALDYAHGKGIIHRDVKPSNIIIDPQGRAILTDFGLALLVEAGTRGEIFGSPLYIAPEQAISSANATMQSDLYSVGVILYEMLTGRVPFTADNPLDVALLHMTEPPRPPSQLNPKITPQLETVVLKALAKEANDRYQSGEELAKALDQALQADPVVAPLVAPLVAPIVLSAPTAYALPPIPAAVAVPAVKAAEPVPVMVEQRRSRKPLAVVSLLLLLLIGGAFALSRRAAIELGPLAAIFSPVANTATIAASSTPPVRSSETAASETVAPASAAQAAAQAATLATTHTSTATVRSATTTHTLAPQRTLRPTATPVPTRTPTPALSPLTTAASTVAPVAAVQTPVPLKPNNYQVFMPVIMRHYRARR
jgi:serine/threonine protein kinase